ncbi:hypothetical protein [Paenibacillus faecalis]|uniref:hypothetical protein n=1 Tax=Paenibacillus faecalis TaxID=2079532 RepID=UPI0018F8A418|nr:hypothetical protein [Paenibacillus faecalis]
MREDWLLSPESFKAAVYVDDQNDEIIMSNGLIQRVWRISPNAATVSFDNLMTGETIIRGVKPEAMVTIDGEEFAVGGLRGQPDYAYLKKEWIDELTSDPHAFHCSAFETGVTKERFPWKRTKHSTSDPWPAPGVSLQLNFTSTQERTKDIHISVHYEMYDGIPLMCKWLSIHNQGTSKVKLHSFISEILAVVEWDSPVETPDRWDFPNLHVESDYSFQGMAQRKANRTTYWVPDPEYRTQVNVDCQSPALLESRPPLGPDIWIEPDKVFDTFRTYELIFDSTERERKGLTQRRMYRMMAPWTQENPIFLHVQSTDSAVITEAIDQCAEVGFEMVILSFGSKLDMENDDPAYIQKFRELADYAHSKGIAIGGYSLLASRKIAPEHDVVNPDGAYYIHSPCLESKWGQEYFRKLQAFFKDTGFDVLEHDGSYPGDICESTDHPGHVGREDSQWKQWTRISEFYKWCRGNGIYLNVPDWYFLNGSNKAGMGYREVNWALPRERQIMLSRQNIYDGTWEKTPSMGWMFVPLTSYHGGGPETTLEPLCEHLDAYEAHLINNFTAGVQAAYRGFRLYDTEETKQRVKKWVDFYKMHRSLLESDIIHVRRPGGRDIDCILHVNPKLSVQGMAVLYNPLDADISQTIELPLYYTGLRDRARIREQRNKGKVYELDRGYRVQVSVTIPARGVTWLLIEQEK